MKSEGLHPLVTWLPARRQQSLNGEWRSIVDVYDVGATGLFGDGGRNAITQTWAFPNDRRPGDGGSRIEYNFDESPAVVVPGDWNTQHERFHFYEGSMWFRTRFHPEPGHPGGRRILYVGASNHESLVYLNGEALARHLGGYGPFCVDVTDALIPDEENSLVMRVNNTRSANGVPTTRTDWFNYGGILRDVALLDLPKTFIRDAVVQLDTTDPSQIGVEVWLEGADAVGTAEVMVDGVMIGSISHDSDGYGQGLVAAPASLRRWSTGDPVRNRVEVRAGGDVVEDLIGFRTVTTSGTEIMLNGEPIFLAGIALHDEALGDPARRVRTEAEARELVGEALALGANFVRLAHYQHNEHTVRACDELGVLAWCELPVYWGIAWENPDTLANARSQLAELIVRDRNRAAVVLWSVANETFSQPARDEFLRTLIGDARALDPTRLVTAALFAWPPDHDFAAAISGNTGRVWTIDDPLGADVDVLGVNQYHGWYYGNPENMATLTWENPHGKPLVISEFGGGALRGRRGELDEDWTEDQQAEIYRNQFAMLSRISFLAGTTPWILKDFRAPFRLLPGVQDGFNRKGLIDLEGNRKLAWDVVAAWNADRTAAGSGSTAGPTGERS